jgi:hydroxyacylglutathione hydrolase
MMQVMPVSAFSDNYIWLITGAKAEADTTTYTAIVDPGDAAPVLLALEAGNMQPEAILITHHHADHVGGIAGILEKYPDTPVYGPANEFIPHITKALKEGDVVKLDTLGLRFEVMDIPGHTAGHIAYYGAGGLFSGDTLFANGCGRVFDGSLSDLHASLRRIAELPVETLIYCAHEYTLDNIGFAKWVEPENPDLLARQEASWDLIDQGKPTVPSTLELEFKTNPFLRTHLPEVITKAEEIAGRETQTSEDVFAVLRVWKDTEYD